jgi:7-cyano-7-deazaguanine reductase
VAVRVVELIVLVRVSSNGVAESSRNTDFVALGQPGFERYAGLESFPNPGVVHVEMTSDELTSVCPVTGQPDFYVVTIAYEPEELCLESKSLKLYLARFREEGAFCEALAVKIRDDAAHVLGLDADRVQVTLEQKPRGGITIVATA